MSYHDRIKNIELGRQLEAVTAERDQSQKAFRSCDLDRTAVMANCDDLETANDKLTAERDRLKLELTNVPVWKATCDHGPYFTAPNGACPEFGCQSYGEKVPRFDLIQELNESVERAEAVEADNAALLADMVLFRDEDIHGAESLTEENIQEVFEMLAARFPEVRRC